MTDYEREQISKQFTELSKKVQAILDHLGMVYDEKPRLSKP